MGSELCKRHDVMSKIKWWVELINLACINRDHKLYCNIDCIDYELQFWGILQKNFISACAKFHVEWNIWTLTVGNFF